MLEESTTEPAELQTKTVASIKSLKTCNQINKYIFNRQISLKCFQKCQISRRSATWQEEVCFAPVAFVLVAAHAVVLAREASHLLVHAVRLGGAVFVAAILEAEDQKKNGSSPWASFFTPALVHFTLQNVGQISKARGWARRDEGEITQGITCKSLLCRTGNAGGYLSEA